MSGEDLNIGEVNFTIEMLFAGCIGIGGGKFGEGGYELFGISFGQVGSSD